jgi:hypothetical protein
MVAIPGASDDPSTCRQLVPMWMDLSRDDDRDEVLSCLSSRGRMNLSEISSTVPDGWVHPNPAIPIIPVERERGTRLLKLKGHAPLETNRTILRVDLNQQPRALQSAIDEVWDELLAVDTEVNSIIANVNQNVKHVDDFTHAAETEFQQLNGGVRLVSAQMIEVKAFLLGLQQERVEHGSLPDRLVRIGEECDNSFKHVMECLNRNYANHEDRFTMVNSMIGDLHAVKAEIHTIRGSLEVVQASNAAFDSQLHHLKGSLLKCLKADVLNQLPELAAVSHEKSEQWSHDIQRLENAGSMLTTHVHDINGKVSLLMDFKSEGDRKAGQIEHIIAGLQTSVAQVTRISDEVKTLSNTMKKHSTWLSEEFKAVRKEALNNAVVNRTQWEEMDQQQARQWAKMEKAQKRQAEDIQLMMREVPKVVANQAKAMSELTTHLSTYLSEERVNHKQQDRVILNRLAQMDDRLANRLDAMEQRLRSAESAYQQAAVTSSQPPRVDSPLEDLPALSPIHHVQHQRPVRVEERVSQTELPPATHHQDLQHQRPVRLEERVSSSELPPRTRNAGASLFSPDAYLPMPQFSRSALQSKPKEGGETPSPQNTARTSRKEGRSGQLNFPDPPPPSHPFHFGGTPLPPFQQEEGPIPHFDLNRTPPPPYLKNLNPF